MGREQRQPVDLEAARAFVKRIRSGDPRGDAFAGAEGVRTVLMEAVEIIEQLVTSIEEIEHARTEADSAVRR